MSGKKTRQIKNVNQHRQDDSSKMVPLTVPEYETLTNKILELNTVINELLIARTREVNKLTFDLENTKELARKETSVIVISPKIRRTLKYSFTRFAMRLMAVKEQGEVARMIDHAVEQASKFLQAFSIKGEPTGTEKDLFFEEEVNGVINVSDYDPKN